MTDTSLTIRSVWCCRACDVGGVDADPACWMCGSTDVQVTARIQGAASTGGP